MVDETPENRVLISDPFAEGEVSSAVAAAGAADAVSVKTDGSAKSIFPQKRRKRANAFKRG